MSINVRQPFGPFLFACFDEYRRESLPNGKFSQQLWEEKAEEFHAAWHAANDKKPAKRAVRQTDDDWIAELETASVFAGIDIRKELGKAQFWCRESNRICTRKFFTNWLNKAERTIAGVATDAKRKFVVVSPEPPDWILWMRAHRPDWRRFAEEKDGHPVPIWAGLMPDERNYILSQLK